MSIKCIILNKLLKYIIVFNISTLYNNHSFRSNIRIPILGILHDSLINKLLLHS